MCDLIAIKVWKHKKVQHLLVSQPFVACFRLTIPKPTFLWSKRWASVLRSEDVKVNLPSPVLQGREGQPSSTWGDGTLREEQPSLTPQAQGRDGQRSLGKTPVCEGQPSLQDNKETSRFINVADWKCRGTNNASTCQEARHRKEDHHLVQEDKSSRCRPRGSYEEVGEEDEFACVR